MEKIWFKLSDDVQLFSSLLSLMIIWVECWLFPLEKGVRRVCYDCIIAALPSAGPRMYYVYHQPIAFIVSKQARSIHSTARLSLA